MNKDYKKPPTHSDLMNLFIPNLPKECLISRASEILGSRSVVSVFLALYSLMYHSPPKRAIAC